MYWFVLYGVPTSNFILEYCFSVITSNLTFPSLGKFCIILFSIEKTFSGLLQILEYIDNCNIVKPSYIRYFLKLLATFLCLLVFTGKSKI